MAKRKIGTVYKEIPKTEETDMRYVEKGKEKYIITHPPTRECYYLYEVTKTGYKLIKQKKHPLFEETGSDR
jgi:hypothetical protein